jgi:hypothetical protein
MIELSLRQGILRIESPFSDYHQNGNDFRSIVLDQTGNARWLECSESQNSTLDCSHDQSSNIIEGWPLIVTEMHNSMKKARKRKPMQKGRYNVCYDVF